MTYESLKSFIVDCSMPEWTAERPLQVVTGYTRIAERFFREKGFKHVALSNADGALEAGPLMGTADIILDLVPAPFTFTSALAFLAPQSNFPSSQPHASLCRQCQALREQQKNLARIKMCGLHHGGYQGHTQGLRLLALVMSDEYDRPIMNLKFEKRKAEIAYNIYAGKYRSDSQRK